MKILYTFAFFSITSLFAQQNQIGFFNPIDSPYKKVMPYMSSNWGTGLSYAHRISESFPMYLELKGSVGVYAAQNLNQTYQFTNGSTTQTSVTYTSSMNKLLLGSKFIISNDFRPVRLYLTPQIGIAGMRSKIVIADPQDEDDCKPLEKKTVQKDMGFVYGGEIGLQWDMNAIFRKVEKENTHHLTLSFSFLTSPSKFSYVNVKHMQDGDMDMANMDMASDPNRTDLNAQFINVSTNTIHEHKIAELYNTKFQMWGINLGYVFTF